MVVSVLIFISLFARVIVEASMFEPEFKFKTPPLIAAFLKNPDDKSVMPFVCVNEPLNLSWATEIERTPAPSFLISELSSPSIAIFKAVVNWLLVSVVASPNVNTLFSDSFTVVATSKPAPSCIKAFVFSQSFLPATNVPLSNVRSTLFKEFVPPKNVA